MSQKRRFVKPPEFIVTEREGMLLLYVTGVFGGLAPNDARVIFVADRLELEPADVPGDQKVKRINQEIQAEIHMSPATFKSVALWMMGHLQRYEKTFGQIPMEPQKAPTESKEGYIG